MFQSNPMVNNRADIIDNTLTMAGAPSDVLVAGCPRRGGRREEIIDICAAAGPYKYTARARTRPIRGSRILLSGYAHVEKL